MIESDPFVIDCAQPDDEPAIRLLLRQHPMEGKVRLSFEREPDVSIAAGIEGYSQQTFLLRKDGQGQILGMGSRSVRRVWLNGNQVNVGYLNQLRRDASMCGPCGKRRNE